MDPIPTILLKDCSHIFAPIVAEIVNLSMNNGVVPAALKLAHVHPTLKKSSLNPELLKNYRPISNLPYISKVLERVVFSRLSDYLRENNLLDSRQSAYRAHHSVETLLVNLSNDILMEMDLGRITVLVSLDLSSTFDTVHHDILLNILSSLGIQDVVLDWLKSYLTDRQQVMYINGTQSDPVSLNCGVPQGSVGGPMLFSIYLSELRDVFDRHHIRYHCYADDVQIYVSFVPNQQNASSAIHKLESCLVDVIQWMGSHSLKLNNEKSEMILLGSVAHLAKVKVSHINIGNCKIKPSVVCKNLGVTFDSAMSMSNQVSNICKSVWCQL